MSNMVSVKAEQDTTRGLGIRLRQARLRKRAMSQGQLASLLCVSRQTISNWENGRASPSVRQLALLCRKLEIPVGDLLGDRFEERRDLLPDTYLQQQSALRAGRDLSHQPACVPVLSWTEAICAGVERTLDRIRARELIPAEFHLTSLLEPRRSLFGVREDQISEVSNVGTLYLCDHASTPRINNALVLMSFAGERDWHGARLEGSPRAQFFTCVHGKANTRVARGPEDRIWAEILFVIFDGRSFPPPAQR